MNKDNIREGLFKEFLKHLFVLLMICFPIYSILNSLEGLDPVSRQLKDFSFTDYFFLFDESKEDDDGIFFVNIGKENKVDTRNKVADFIHRINQNEEEKPKVIALNMYFPYAGTNEVPDSVNEKLVEALSHDNIVLSYSLGLSDMNYDSNSVEEPPLIKIRSTEFPIPRQEGFINLHRNKDAQCDYCVKRFFEPYHINETDLAKSQMGDTSLHFTLAVAKKAGYDDGVENLLKDKSNKCMINYKYRFPDSNYIDITSSENYIMKDKIVILGQFEKADIYGKKTPFYMEDIHYTPLNSGVFRSPPDMYGGEIFGIIISSIRDNNFIKTTDKKLRYALNIIPSIIIYFILMFLLRTRHESLITNEITVKSLQFLFVAVSIVISSYLLPARNIYLDLSLLALILFLAIEFIEAVKQILIFLENSSNRRRLFLIIPFITLNLSFLLVPNWLNRFLNFVFQNI